MTRDLHKSTIRLPEDDVRGTIENPGFLVAKSGDNDATRLDRRIMIIGSDDTAEVQIDGSGIAAYHAEITYDEGTYIVQHCDGNEPLKVNGEAIEVHTLIDGDVIAIGDHWFTFKHHDGNRDA